MKRYFLYSVLTFQYLYLLIPGLAQPRIEVDPLELEVNPLWYNEAQLFVINISNAGDEVLRFNIEVEFLDDDEAIFEIDRVEGEIAPGNETETIVGFYDYEIDPGDHRANIHILSNDPDNGDIIVTFFVNIWWPPAPGFMLEPGWRLVSSPNRPSGNRNIPNLFHYMVENHSLLLIKDGQGRFFSPLWNYNNIPFWDNHQGYYFKMAEADTFFIDGRAVSPDTLLQLQIGWNAIAFFPQESIEAPVAFRGIERILIMPKDGSGHFYCPEHDFNNIPPLHLGEGYLVKLRESAEFIWNTR